VHMHVTNFLFLLAFVPAVVLFAARAYLKTHPPDTSEYGIRTLLRGLAFGVASTFALPLIYIVHDFQLVRYTGNLPDIVFSFAGNIINFIAAFECAYKRTGPGLGVALFLVIVQLMWVWSLFGAFTMAN
jgi:hypothetical protein